MQRKRLQQRIFPEHGSISEAPRLDKPRRPTAWQVLALESWSAQHGGGEPALGPREQRETQQLTRADFLRAFGLEEASLAALVAQVARENARQQPLEEPERGEWELTNLDDSDAESEH